jgi:L-ribulose-5-phosphate 4-epimerase
MLEQLKQTLYELHMELPRNNLVTWTSGNVSAWDRESGYVVIKPSGVRYEAMRPEHMIVVDLEGKVIEGNLKPSSDTASHLYIYRNRSDVGGIVHTHCAMPLICIDRQAYPCLFNAAGRRISVRYLCWLCVD